VGGKAMTDGEFDFMRSRRANLYIQYTALGAEIGELDRVIRDEESRRWVARNRVTSDSVQLSTAPGLPHWWTIDKFAAWLRAQDAPKPYAEWNERIYRTDDLLDDRMPDMPGFLKHVEEASR
jgi:hypothetical protein